MKVLIILFTLFHAHSGEYLNFDFGAALTGNQFESGEVTLDAIRPGLAVYSDIIYELGNAHLGISSHVNLTHTNKAYPINGFNLPEQNLLSVQSFFGVHAKYFFPGIKMGWPIFITASYGVSVLSARVKDENQLADDADTDKRVVFEGLGYSLGLGLKNGRNFYQILLHRADYDEANLITGELKESDVLLNERLFNNLEFYSLMLIWSVQLF